MTDHDAAPSPGGEEPSPQPPEKGACKGDPPPDPHGPLYYLGRNVGRMIWQNRAVRVLAVVLPFALAIGLYLGRVIVHKRVIAFRRHSPEVVSLLLLVGLVWAVRRAMAGRPRLSLAVCAALVAAWLGLLVHPGAFWYELSLYHGYSQIDRRELVRLPLTSKERIYPLTMVDRIVEDRLTGSHFDVSKFELVRIKDRLYWTAQKTPVGTVNRLSMEDVTGIVSVEASRATFEMKHHKVDFAYGRDMFFFKDLASYILPRRLSVLDLLDKEVDGSHVSYLQDDGGEWVQVVPVIDWDGIFPFVAPRFGGVFVVPQRGKGEIRRYLPAEIPACPFLKNQPLLPTTISNFYAEAWKYNQGFYGWLRSRGTTKITHIPEDTNQQPFTVFFRDVNGQEGLYQFYALEPEGASAGLSKILLFDPHGYGPRPTVFWYDFDARGEALVGPERIAETIKGSDLHADWKVKAAGGTFIIAESRPYIKEKGGARSFRWFNSIITERRGSLLPIIVIADPGSLKVQWFEGDAIRQLIEE